MKTLYKKTSTGATQFWSISTNESVDQTCYEIVTSYGQLNTSKVQTTIDRIQEGKNLGKKNETTIQQQAEFEAKAKWEKQKKKGYVESIEAAQTDQVDALIEGGVVPMLAHSFDDHKAKIKYPCAVQPKLDGIRCIAVIKEGQCTLWSRTRKRIYSVPHIVSKLEELFKAKTIILDGELYNHKYKDNFEEIVSLVRQEEPGESHEKVQYHIYDVITDEPFRLRLSGICGTIESMGEVVKLVLYATAKDDSEVLKFSQDMISCGFEGAMARNLESKYENKRSYNLQKVKTFQDAEFEITDVVEGRGKMAGHAIFVLKTKDGTPFEAKMQGSLDNLKAIWEHKQDYIGHLLTVQYQGLTNKNRVPRFPVGLRLRVKDL